MLTFLVIALILFGGKLDDTSTSELSFQYRAFGGDDEMDQVLEITNNGSGAVAPTLEITPLDKSGQPIGGLRVTGAYGSERGARVVPAYYTDIDVLHFEGERAGDVRNVRVRVKTLEQVDGDIIEDVTLKAYNEGKRAPKFDDPFDAVELDNPNDAPVKVQVVLIGWDAARKGNPQQALWSVKAGPPVEVGARQRKMVPLPGDLAGISYVSVKTYLVPTS